MSSNHLTLPILPARLVALVRALWDRDRDPYLDALRWRLHLRLLLVSCALSAAFFLVHLMRGRVDEVGLGVLISLGAWAWLRTRPQHSRMVSRLVLAGFMGLALNAIFLLETPAVQWAFLAMMIMPVFGALLDGIVSGGVVTAIVLVSSGLCLASGRTSGMPLVVAFASLAALCLYLTSLAHAWMFNNLVARQRDSGRAIAETTRLAEQLGVTLHKDVASSIARLRASLAKGLNGLEQTRDLQQVLALTRAKLPADLPRSAMEPTQLLDTLRHSVHRSFLGVAFGVSLLATVTVLWLGQDLWELAALVATCTAMLLWLGAQDRSNWHWRLFLFLLACLAAMAADIAYSIRPPAASLVFLPLIVFFAGMLAAPAWSFTVCLAGLALLGWSQVRFAGAPGVATVLLVLAMVSLTVLAFSHATASAYQRQLESMLVEEEGLRRSLSAYRRMVSTLFHDLANPLAVIQTLAALPPALITQEDGARTKRMLQRMEDVAQSARQAAQPGSEPDTSVALVVDQLFDLFRDQLRDKQLKLQLVEGADVMLKRGGGLLRDLMLGHLLSNALKYSPKAGLITLEARAHDGWIVLTLRDQGPGYPADVLRDVADGLSPRVRPGTQGELGNGFGLLEASASASELGGHLTLRNRAEGGAEAELWLPEGHLGR